MIEPPYPASWVDRLIDRIAALPGPSWAVYAIVAVVVFLTIHAVAWLEGVIAPGDVDLYLGSLAIYVIASVGFIHALDHRAARAWRTFRPATALTDEEAERVELELTTLPARAAIAWTVVGFLVAVLTFIAGSGDSIGIAGGPLTAAVAFLVGSFAYASGGVLVVGHAAADRRREGHPVLVGQPPP